MIFNSKVVVDAGASQSDSQQSCRGLLLSPSAEIDSRPQLEIHTDEVKCAHGATTGRLDPNMLFYMLSRGLDRETAQSLLVYAFLADVLTGMSVSSARSAIESALIRTTARFANAAEIPMNSAARPQDPCPSTCRPCAVNSPCWRRRCTASRWLPRQRRLRAAPAQP